LLPPAVSQQSGFLAKGYDPTRPSLHGLVICSPCNPVVTGKSDQLFDVGIPVVPLLDHVRQIELAPRSHTFIREQTGNASGTKPVNRFRVYPNTTMEAKMADRDVFARSAREDRTLPSGIHPIIGILLSIIAIVGFLLIAAIFHRDKSADFIKADLANVQIPSTE
jgi:hypothetical protein